MRLRAGLRVLRRGPDEVQVGTDPRWAVRVTDLAPAEVERLVKRGLDGLDRAGSRLGTVGEQLLLAGLAVAGEHVPLTACADDPAWGLLRPGDDPRARARRRAAACVGVVGLGPTGLGVAVALAAAGVGTVKVDDESPVGALDVGVGGYRWADVGLPREAAAARVLRDVTPGLTLDGPAEPRVIVTVEPGAADPDRALRLLGAGVPQLSVVIREADTVVGPLVVPGTGPCLRCLDLLRAELDPAWALLLPQLLASDPPEPGPVAAVSAGLAAAAVLGLLDGLPPDVGRTWEVGLPDAAPRERLWAVHPDCGCSGLPD